MKAFAFLLPVFAAFGQAPPVGPAGGEAPLALVRFQVAPQKGKPVTDLRAEDIEIREDGVSKKVEVLQSGASATRDIPIEVSFVFDCARTALSSGALSPQLLHEGLLNEFPTASISIYGFAPSLTRLAAPTRSQPDLAKALDAPLLVHPLSTFLMDHVSRVLIDSASSPGAAVRMVVVLSTGITDQGSQSDTEQQQRFERAIAIAQQANISAYPVVLLSGLANQDATPDPAQLTRASRVPGPQMTMKTGITSSTAARALGNFSNLGAVTGGTKLEMPGGGNLLPTVVKWIADEIRNDYVAAFQVTTAAAKKRHKIEVIMRNKDRGKITTGALNLVY